MAPSFKRHTVEQETREETTLGLFREETTQRIAELTKRLARILGLDAQREPGEPRITIEIIYGSHGSFHDGFRLKKILRSADIFVPEMIGWTEDHKKIYEALSQGELRPFFSQNSVHEIDYPLHEFGLQNALYKSGVHVEFIDLPLDESSPATPYRRYMSTYESITATRKKIEPQIFFVPLDNLVQEEKAYTGHFAAMQSVRERYMVERLKELIAHVRQEHGMSDVHIVVQLGSMHTPVYHLLKTSHASDLGVKRTMTGTHQGTYMFYPGNFLWRKRRLKGVVSYEDCVRDLFFTIFGRCYNDEFYDLQKKTGSLEDPGHVIYLIISRFTVSELTAFYEAIQQFSLHQKGMSSEEQYNALWARARALFDELLEQKGIQFPTSKKELQHLVEVGRIKKPLFIKTKSFARMKK